MAPVAEVMDHSAGGIEGDIHDNRGQTIRAGEVGEQVSTGRSRLADLEVIPGESTGAVLAPDAVVAGIDAGLSSAADAAELVLGPACPPEIEEILRRSQDSSPV